jgi:hypothetical protein
MRLLGAPKYRLDALRFARRLEHVDGETGEVTVWPAMVAAMTRGREIVAVHRTWLEPEGRGKAPVKQPKKMLGPARAAAIRLTLGSAGMSATRAATAGKLGPLAVGEGIETTLTVAAAMPDWRTWAAGSLTNMGAVEWPACASEVWLLRDRDSKAAARAQFEAAHRHWRAQAAGRRLEVVESAAGKDFNDWLGAA